MIVKRAMWWDYKKEASYFITFNVLNKQKKLGEVRSKIMNLNQLESNLKVYKYPSDCIRALKAKAAYQIRKLNSNFQWQDNFYEIIIKNIYHHQKVIEYIKNNAKNYNI